MVQTTHPKGAAKAEVVRIIPWLQVRILPVPFFFLVYAFRDQGDVDDRVAFVRIREGDGMAETVSLSKLIIVSITGAAWALSLIVAFVLGGIFVESRFYAHETKMKIERLRPIVVEHPGLEIGSGSGGIVGLYGNLDSPDSARDLEEQVIREFGRTEAAHILGTLETKPDSPRR